MSEPGEKSNSNHTCIRFPEDATGESPGHVWIETPPSREYLQFQLRRGQDMLLVPLKRNEAIEVAIALLMHAKGITEELDV